MNANMKFFGVLSALLMVLGLTTPASAGCFLHDEVKDKNGNWIPNPDQEGYEIQKWLNDRGVCVHYTEARAAKKKFLARKPASAKEVSYQAPAKKGKTLEQQIAEFHAIDVSGMTHEQWLAYEKRAEQLLDLMD